MSGGSRSQPKGAWLDSQRLSIQALVSTLLCCRTSNKKPRHYDEVFTEVEILMRRWRNEEKACLIVMARF